MEDQNAPNEGMGDDEEIQIGGTVAGMRTKGPVVTETTQQVTNTAVVQNVAVTQMVAGVAVDPTTGQQYATPMMVQGVVGYVSYQQTITTQTHTRLDPGNYEGDVGAEGERSGDGRCHWADGSLYQGRWEKGFRHGNGRFVSREKTEYVGEFYNDIRHGAGVLTYQSGNKIIGTWENDRLNGEGTIINKGKKPKKCVFKEDLAIESAGQGEQRTMVLLVTSILLCLVIYVLALVNVLTVEAEEQGTLFNIYLVLYLFYMGISYCASDAWKFVINITKYKETIENIHKAIAFRPILKHFIQCYHFDQYQRKNEQGQVVEVINERVNTHKAEEEHEFTEWTNKSPPAEAIQHIDVFLLCRLHTDKTINYSPVAWASRNRQRESFIDRNNKDTHYDYSFFEHIADQPSHNLVHNPERGPLPWYANICVLILLDLLVFGWIPKYLLDRNSTKVAFSLEKYVIR